MLFKVMILLLIAQMMSEISIAGTPDEYCHSEIFQPRCLKNEVILMKSATFGRMRVGRCITAEEVEALGERYLGCSVDVLPMLDRECSGKSECDIRVVEISVKDIKPCIPVLRFHLEADYECISVADEKRSCAVDVSSIPIHIVDFSTCGTKSQPWIVEAPIGQKISISLLAFSHSEMSEKERKVKQSCRNYGVVVDNVGKRNVSICPVETLRETNLYLSAGNVLNIILNSTERGNLAEGRRFIIKLQAVGCSDIIPPEDAYLKRNGDAVMVGCYTSRKSWHLSCEDGKWIGVIGNCSQGSSIQESISESELKQSGISNEQGLIMLALGGLTLALCLAIVCFGAVCWRRFYSKSKMKQDYKTLNYQINSTGVQPVDRRMHSNVATDFPANDMSGMVAQPMPTYSVFVSDDGEFNSGNNSVNLNGQSSPL